MMNKEATNHKIELVAQAIHDAEQQACQWNDEPTGCKERFREYARNAIKLLNDDIGVLLNALAEEAAARHRAGPRTSA
jgi:hypothetical protein